MADTLTIRVIPDLHGAVHPANRAVAARPAPAARPATRGAQIAPQDAAATTASMVAARLDFRPGGYHYFDHSIIRSSNEQMLTQPSAKNGRAANQRKRRHD
ncbi:hypothetical protein [Caballeronia hypogeia]|uniref:hypothetical protein n=1 Tax=Caballeronia hypogeia TaxID=1777140 RepID=UPI000A793F9E|nr:hypothetical protein [Caballeronia hypogeia]